jgi:hypothetical protein
MQDIPGFDGYRERELRRTADKLVREQLVVELDQVRDALKDVTRVWASAGALTHLTDLDRLSRLLGKARDNLRFADYGYTGFFDAVKIGEEGLDGLYEYDESLREDVQACREAVEQLAEADEAALPERVSSVESAIRRLQDRIDRREQVVASAAEDEDPSSLSP